MGKLTSITKLAAEACVDLRTAKKAVLHGAESIKGRTGERVADAAKRLGIELGGADVVSR